MVFDVVVVEDVGDEVVVEGIVKYALDQPGRNLGATGDVGLVRV